MEGFNDVGADHYFGQADFFLTYLFIFERFKAFHKGSLHRTPFYMGPINQVSASDH